MAILKAQLNARGGFVDINKVGISRPYDESNGPRSKSLYTHEAVGDYLSTSHAPDSNEIDFLPHTETSHNYDGSHTNYLYEEPSNLQSDGGSISQINHSHKESMRERGRTPIRGSRSGGQEMGHISSAILNDRFDHYNRPPSRPPSRDRSVDRYMSRGQTPVPQELINPRSRAPSAQRTSAHQDWTPDSGVFEEDLGSCSIPAGTARSRQPSRTTSSLLSGVENFTGNGSIGGFSYNIPTNQQEAESLLRQRACGQEIPPAMTPGGTVKRTESLYINPIIRRQAQVKVRSIVF